MTPKRYYWLKLKDDFFKSREIKKLRGIAGGDTFTIIYLKMQLLSIKNEGMLIFEGTEENIEEQLAIELDEDIDNIKMTIAFISSNLLFEQITQDEYLLTKVPEIIGSETDAAERMRRLRKKRNDVTPMFQGCSNELHRDREREKRIENRDILSGKAEPHVYKEVISYLNQKTESNYRESSPIIKSLIDDKMHEGFTLEDLKRVIDVKAKDWIGSDNEKYLRPETLFGTKFESYLNQKEKKTPVPPDPPKSKYDYDKITKRLREKMWETSLPNSPDT